MITVWPSDLVDYIRFAIPSEKPGELCFDTLSEDYKQMAIVVVRPSEEGYETIQNTQIPLKAKWHAKLRLASDDFVSVILGGGDPRVLKQQVYIRHTLTSSTEAVEHIQTFVLPIVEKGWPRRRVLTDGETLIDFLTFGDDLLVQGFKDNNIVWSKTYKNIRQTAPLFVGGILTYAFIRSDGKVEVFDRSKRDTETYAEFPEVPADLKSALAKKERNVCFAGNILVWQEVKQGGAQEYHICESSGKRHTLKAQDEFVARSPLRIIPKFRNLEEAARSDPEVSNFILRNDGRRQPADVIASGARIMPLDEKTIVLVDNSYQRITTIRKAD